MWRTAVFLGELGGPIHPMLTSNSAADGNGIDLRNKNGENMFFPGRSSRGCHVAMFDDLRVFLVWAFRWQIQFGGSESSLKCELMGGPKKQ